MTPRCNEAIAGLGEVRSLVGERFLECKRVATAIVSDPCQQIFVMQPHSLPHRLMRTPIWAARVLQFMFALAMLLLAAFFVPSWKCDLARPLVGVLGLAWLLFGAFSFWFSWALPRRGGGGFYSPTSDRPIWLAFCFGMMAVGATCLLAFNGYIPVAVKSCA